MPQILPGTEQALCEMWLHHVGTECGFPEWGQLRCKDFIFIIISNDRVPFVSTMSLNLILVIFLFLSTLKQEHTTFIKIKNNVKGAPCIPGETRKLNLFISIQMMCCVPRSNS